MSRSNVLYCESWGIIKHFPDESSCEMRCTLTISKTQKGYKSRTVTSYVNVPRSSERTRSPSWCNLEECIAYALEWMYKDKWGIGQPNLSAGVSVEDVIRESTGFTHEQAHRFSWKEVNPMIDCKVLEKLCRSNHADKQAWNQLVERVNKKVAYDLFREAGKYRSARTKRL